LDHAEAHPDLEVGPRYQDPLGMDDDRIGMRFEVDVPLFDRNQGTICESAAQIRANRAQLHVAELRTLSDVASAYSELVAIQNSLRFFDSRVARLVDDTESLLGQEAVRQGISDYQERRIRLALARMSVNRLELRYRYERISTRLKVFLGQPITQP
jgi:outer membrane protein TolC